ncbi:hypothetical protein Tco_1096353 [Tanacetum coccineum]
MASQDARLSKFEADFKHRQSEMTHKIDTVLKAITNQIAGTLPSDTVKNPKLSTSLVLAARSYPTKDPQCSTHVHGYNKDDEGIEWLDVEEPLDLVDTSEESVYESLIKEMPKCSLNYDFRIKKGDPRNLKIPCIIGHKFIANGKKFCRIKKGHARICRKYELRHRSELSSEGHNLLSSRVILSEDGYDRGCRKPSDLEDGFYKDTIKLGPEYVTGMDDEGEVT